MPQLILPISLDGLCLDAIIGVDGATTQSLVSARQPIPAPQPARALIDTGTDITAVRLPILQRLGVPAQYTATTHTVGGLVKTNLFEVSLAITDLSQASALSLVESSWLVMELASALPGIDVLIGLDLLLELRFLLDGPARHFTLDF
jgi:predicted aspartyl protease